MPQPATSSDAAPTVAAVVLAAGAASRFGAPKQALLLPLVLERVVSSAILSEIVVVEGAHPLEGVPLGTARRVACAAWRSGPGASLRCGLGALPADVAAAVVILADGPLLAPAAITRVVERWRAGGDEVVAASYGGERGHPLLVARAAWGAIPDEGLRGVDATLVACDELGAPGDVDHPGDWPAV